MSRTGEFQRAAAPRPKERSRSPHPDMGRPRRVPAGMSRYNTRRRNHGDFMAGRTPQQVLDTHLNRKAA